MSRAQWFGSLALLSWGLIRVLAGVWMHAHPEAFQQALHIRGWRLVRWLAGLLLVMSFLDPAPWGWSLGRVDRTIVIAEYWFLTDLILILPFFVFADATN